MAFGGIFWAPVIKMIPVSSSQSYPISLKPDFFLKSLGILNTQYVKDDFQGWGWGMGAILSVKSSLCEVKFNPSKSN